MRITKNTAFKNQLRNFNLHDKNLLYGIILVHLTSNIALKTRKRLLAAGYRFFFNCQNSKFRLTHSLTDHSCKPRAQAKQHVVTILHHNNKLTGGMSLWDSDKCTPCVPCLFFYLQSGYLSSSSNEIISRG